MSDVRAGTTGGQEGTAAIAETVSEQATKAKETGRRELREQLDERTTQVGRQARSLAETLRRSAQSLQAQGKDEVGVERITTGVADRLERAGGYLERARGDEMLRDAERFVRSRPWLVTSAAAAAGFVASRVFKASSESRYEPAPAATGYPQTDNGRRYSDSESAAPRAPQTAGTAS